MEGKDVGPRRGQKEDSLEIFFKNHMRVALRCGTVSRRKIQKFKLSFTWLKGPISAGVFFLFGY